MKGIQGIPNGEFFKLAKPLSTPPSRYGGSVDYLVGVSAY